MWNTIRNDINLLLATSLVFYHTFNHSKRSGYQTLPNFNIIIYTIMLKLILTNSFQPNKHHNYNYQLSIHSINVWLLVNNNSHKSMQKHCSYHNSTDWLWSGGRKLCFSVMTAILNLKHDISQLLPFNIKCNI